MKMGRSAEAEEALDVFLTEFPECEAALVQRVLLLLHRGWWRRAEEFLTRLRAVEPAGRTATCVRAYAGGARVEVW